MSEENVSPKSSVGNARWSTNDKRKAFRLNKKGLCPREIALEVNRSEAGVIKLLRANGHKHNPDPTKRVEKVRSATIAAMEKEEAERTAKIQQALTSTKEVKSTWVPPLEHNPYLLIL